MLGFSVAAVAARRFPRVLALVLSGLLLTAGRWSFAQEAPTPGGPPPESTAAPEQQDSADTQTFKVTANLVNLYFSVRDKNGFITNLHKDDCSITEDKAPQVTKRFTQEKNLPLTIGILLDTSGSQQNVLPLEQESARRF